jgi:hypothetical protein
MTEMFVFRIYSKKLRCLIIWLLVDVWGYWHCGQSWPIVPASGDRKMIVEKQMGCRLAGKPMFSEKTWPGATFVHHKIPYDQTRVWTRAAAVGSRRLTVWAIARPTISESEHLSEDGQVRPKHVAVDLIVMLCELKRDCEQFKVAPKAEVSQWVNSDTLCIFSIALLL